MIVGVGFDLIEHCRVERELAQGPWLTANGVFTEEEIGNCERARRPGAQYAACFAAKEATLKALGIDISDVGLFREVEVMKDADGKHSISLNARLQKKAQQLGVSRVWLSIASTKKRAAALVVLES
jgi:holo-[acyl-carrier protein] synthase